VAKILVADDNSNVQKTMALALSDLGVEVISVNNGEAAVRRLAEISPDLVLADIFMPVRNGYEVCEYVKKDPRFSHVPVVLLVGAFDPFDEREAQRVGADGILKKPFVPPDPLITMVKTLLDKGFAERLVPVSASVASEASEVSKASDTAAIHTIANPANTAVKVNGIVPSPAVEELPEELPAPSTRISFGEGAHPVAFGDLLEMTAKSPVPHDTAAVKPPDNEQVLTSSRDATLGEPAFWRNELPKSEPEETHPVDVSDDVSQHSWQPDKDTLLHKAHDASALPAIEPIELVTEEHEETASSVVDPQPVVLDQAAQASTTVEPGQSPELVADPLEWMATESQHHAEVKSETVPESTPELPEEVALSADPTAVEPTAHVEPALESPANHEEVSVAKIEMASAEDTARSIPKDKWAEMTDTIEARVGEIMLPHAAAPPVAHPASSAPATPVSPAVSVDAPKIADAPIQPTPVQAVSNVPDPALVEAVVQRVLDKMRPQVVDIITKEFLRPVVQALVHREIEKR
jgi:CheY-like chemotaxis protein